MMRKLYIFFFWICIIDWDVVVVLQWILLTIISYKTYFSSPPAANLWNML